MGNNSAFWNDDEKANSLNEAMAVWQLMVGEWTADIGMTVTSDLLSNYFDVPKQVVSIQRVLYNNVPLTETSVWDLDQLFSSGWEGTGTLPTWWAAIGLNKVALYPQPSVGGNIEFQGISEVPFPLNGGDWVNFGDELLTAFLKYEHHYLTFKEGGAELQGTLDELQSFVKAAILKNKQISVVAPRLRYMGYQGDERENPQTGNLTEVGGR